jgi:hypothetical protein
MSKLIDEKVNIKIRLSALWASVLSLYIYCDYFDLYTTDKIQSMIDGTAFFGEVNQTVLLGLSSIMLITSVMIAISILLPAVINRIFNLVIGLIMSLMLGLIAYVSGWYFYKMYAVVEAILTLLIVWYAWNWPREPKSSINLIANE